MDITKITILASFVFLFSLSGGTDASWFGQYKSRKENIHNIQRVFNEFGELFRNKSKESPSLNCTAINNNDQDDDDDEGKSVRVLGDMQDCEKSQMLTHKKDECKMLRAMFTCQRKGWIKCGEPLVADSLIFDAVNEILRSMACSLLSASSIEMEDIVRNNLTDVGGSLAAATMASKSAFTSTMIYFLLTFAINLIDFI